MGAYLNGSGPQRPPYPIHSRPPLPLFPPPRHIFPSHGPFPMRPPRAVMVRQYRSPRGPNRPHRRSEGTTFGLFGDVIGETVLIEEYIFI